MRGAVLYRDNCASCHGTEPENGTQGIYKGVCFPCGHVVKDGTYFLYYGGGDVHCCVATTPLQELIDHLLAQPV